MSPDQRQQLLNVAAQMQEAADKQLLAARTLRGCHPETLSVADITQVRSNFITLVESVGHTTRSVAELLESLAKDGKNGRGRNQGGDYSAWG